MYLVISKFFLETPSLNLTKNYLPRQKKQEKYSFIQYIFECLVYPKQCAHSGYTKVNKTDIVCCLGANTIVGKAVIKTTNYSLII